MAGESKYSVVADVLRREIADGLYRDGDTLSTEEELRMRFRVSRQTVRQAIALLEKDGLVNRRRGSGTYVRHRRRNRSGSLVVGVLMASVTDYIAPAILSGIERVLNDHDVVMSLSATRNDPALERSLLERFLDGQADGLIVEGSCTGLKTPNADYYRRLAERNVPVLFLNGYYREIPWAPHVMMDDREGGRQAAAELINRGYRRIGGLFKTDDMQGQERLAGFLEAAEQRGVPVDRENLLLLDTSERMTLYESDKGVAFMDRIARKQDMDAMICYNDIFAVHLMSRLKQRGMRLPEDLGIISFDNAEVGAMTHPALTTLGHPQEMLGGLAAEKILRMIDGNRENSEELSWSLIERESLGRGSAE